MLFLIKYRGFTLIELIIVIAIVALVAAAIFVAVDPAKRIGEAKDSQRWQDITSIAQAVEQYTADYGDLPSDFASTTIGTGEKVVICDTVTTLTCDGQSRSCLIVDDTDFLGAYLSVISYDPDKSSASDTGYYITRGSGDIMSFGVCGAYTSVGIAMNSKIALPDYVAPPAAPEPPPVICGGYTRPFCPDVTGDGFVGFDDLMHLSMGYEACYDTDPESFEIYYTADCNQDCCIDEIDWGCINAYYNQFVDCSTFVGTCPS